MMKIWILSDLHLNFRELEDIRIPNADVCVIAGDVLHGGPARSVRWVGEHIAKYIPTVFVCGNQEYYQASVKEGLFEGSLESCNYPALHVLEIAFVCPSKLAVSYLQALNYGGTSMSWEYRRRPRCGTPPRS